MYLKLSEEIKEMKRCGKILENTNVMTAELEDKNEKSWHSCIYYYILQLGSASFYIHHSTMHTPPPETRFNAFQQFCTKLQNSIRMDIQFAGYLRIGI